MIDEQSDEPDKMDLKRITDPSIHQVWWVMTYRLARQWTSKNSTSPWTAIHRANIYFPKQNDQQWIKIRRKALVSRS
jgi:hypothetical protein